MKSQQAAEREEQQRIKNLVLRYDLHEDSNDQNGTKDDPWFLSSRGLFNEPLHDGNPNTKGLNLGPDAHHAGGSNRSSRRNRPQVRKLNLNMNDIDWYGNQNKRTGQAPREEQGSASNHSLDAFVKPTKAQRREKETKKPG
jgi:regulator of nonsense transcripts 2